MSLHFVADGRSPEASPLPFYVLCDKSFGMVVREIDMVWGTEDAEDADGTNDAWERQ